jgi:hypothetical protein
MKLALITIVPALAIGTASGGRLRALSSTRVRWWPLALAGVGLQVVPGSGNVGRWLLLTSFALLAGFVIANLRLPGFALILLGVALNFAVIAANQGMPVTRHALEASGQAGTLEELVEEGGAKHHLADEDTRLLFLGDVIPLGTPINRAISIGDVGTHVGVMWFIIVGMHRPLPAPRDEGDGVHPDGDQAEELSREHSA